MIKDIKKVNRIAVHDGDYHADDIFAVATLHSLNPSIEVIRTRDKKILEDVDMRIDVGMKYNSETGDYDHHQKVGERENGVPYAAFGLVWKDYGLAVCDKITANVELDKEIFRQSNIQIDNSTLVKMVDNELVQAIDRHDIQGRLNTEVPVYFLQDVINSSRSEWHQEKKSNEETFYRNVEQAKKIISNNVVRNQGILLSENFWRDAYKSSKDGIIVLDLGTIVPQEYLSETPDAIYSVQRDSQGQFVLKAVNESSNSRTLRKPLPKTWFNKSDEELQKITGVSDAVFCFKDFSVFSKSREGALKLAYLALENRGE